MSSVGGQREKLWYVQTMEYYLVLKRKKLSSRAETRSSPEKATHCMILSI